MKPKEIRQMSDEELAEQVKKLKRELFELKNSINASKNSVAPHLLRQKRKDIARIMTIQTERAIDREIAEFIAS